METKTINQINNFQNSENETGQNLNGATIEQQINIFNSYKTFKPLLNYKKEINIRKQITDNQNIFFYGLTSYVFIIASLYFFSKKFSSLFQLNIFSFNIFSELLIDWSILIAILIINFFILSIIVRPGKLRIEENKIIIEFYIEFFNINKKFFYKRKAIHYKYIRSILKQKTIAGYAIFICKIDELEPYIQFNVDSIHTALAIEELIINKISETGITIPNNGTL